MEVAELHVRGKVRNIYQVEFLIIAKQFIVGKKEMGELNWPIQFIISPIIKIIIQQRKPS